jgi:hypothetical protein
MKRMLQAAESSTPGFFGFICAVIGQMWGRMAGGQSLTD